MTQDCNHSAFARVEAAFSTSLAFGSLRAPLGGVCPI